MNTATTYLKETTRSGSVLWETPVCADCLGAHLRSVTLRRGETRVMRTWNTPDTPCGMCEDEEKAADCQTGAVAR